METLLHRPEFSTTKPENLFGPIADQKGAVWLDSSMQIGDKGRCSFVAHSPVAELIAYKDRIELKGFSDQISVEGIRDPIVALCGLWNDTGMFSVGHISYEATLPFAGIDNPATTDIPLVHFFFYDSALRFEHDTDTYSIIGVDSGTCESFIKAADCGEEYYLREPTRISPALSRDRYFQCLNQIKEHIKEGDIYQANLTCRFDVANASSPFDVYRKLRELNPAPYAAFLNFGDYQVISSSPERMLFREGDSISCCPIKGTIAAGQNEKEQQRNRRQLMNSEKDKAELLMIVDLVRNDLGKVADTGTVQVDNLFDSEDYSTVIHLIANVSAKLRKDVAMAEILAALLPGGSITGAPKRRAVEILHKLEATPRGIYTGCIGFVYGNNADFNIAIRTLTHRDGLYSVNAGGGIVADSDPEREYQEMLLKAANLFKALGAEKVTM